MFAQAVRDIDDGRRSAANGSSFHSMRAIETETHLLYIVCLEELPNVDKWPRWSLYRVFKTL